MSDRTLAEIHILLLLSYVTLGFFFTFDGLIFFLNEIT